ncbi:MAG: hypothetical protein KDC59_17875 [Saprospiraceae bacterium]|nr:hypothetical protein [Saprospiraceae bacterium]HPG09610.1 hypothetical protein [Saprospiraceae bacterium]
MMKIYLSLFIVIFFWEFYLGQSFREYENNIGSLELTVDLNYRLTVENPLVKSNAFNLDFMEEVNSKKKSSETICMIAGFCVGGLLGYYFGAKAAENSKSDIGQAIWIPIGGMAFCGIGGIVVGKAIGRTIDESRTKKLKDTLFIDQ